MRTKGRLGDARTGAGRTCPPSALPRVARATRGLAGCCVAFSDGRPALASRAAPPPSLSLGRGGRPGRRLSTARPCLRARGLEGVGARAFRPKAVGDALRPSPAERLRPVWAIAGLADAICGGGDPFERMGVPGHQPRRDPAASRHPSSHRARSWNLPHHCPRLAREAATRVTRGLPLPARRSEAGQSATTI